jgi:dTDP-glucose 4,6-dehydratase
MAKRVLFTGHGGFVGHHCLEYFLEHTDWELICLDSFRHKGTVLRVNEVIAGDNLPIDRASCNPRVKTYIHDLSVPIDPQLENLIFERSIDDRGVVCEKPIDFIINMASDSAVERSTSDPTHCLSNNWHLCINMLEFARKCKGLEMFLQISTDEVYGEAPPAPEAHKEWAPTLPSNPYAASKAAQEAMAISYWRAYNLPVVITNTMNIVGERQDPEKFLPKIIQKVARGEEMPIYGDSEDSIGTRVYLHAQNMAHAIVFLSKIAPSRYLDLVKEGKTGDTRPDRYNVCGDDEVSNLELAQMVAEIMGSELKWHLVPSESARPGYDRRYALDGSKMKALGWEPPMTLRESVQRIVSWTLHNPHWVV